MRHRLFSVGQTGVYVHVGCWLCAAYFLMMGYGGLFVVSLISVLLHEWSHAAVATGFGMPPAELELTPLGAVMRLEDDWRMPAWQQCAVLAAGPAASLLLCIISLELTKLGLLGQSLGRMCFLCNFALMAGNLLPALPLDGGRLLALGLSRYWSGSTVRQAMRCISVTVGILCVALNVYLSWSNGGWNFTCALAGGFMMYAGCRATVTTAMAEMRMFVERKHRLYRKGAMLCRWVAVAEGIPLRNAVSHLHPSAYTMYAIVQPGSGRIVRRLGEDEIIAAYLREPGGTMRFD